MLLTDKTVAEMEIEDDEMWGSLHTHGICSLWRVR